MLSSTESYLKRPMLDILLNDGVLERSADKALGVENGILGIHCGLALGGISNEPEAGMCISSQPSTFVRQGCL